MKVSAVYLTIVNIDYDLTYQCLSFRQIWQTKHLVKRLANAIIALLIKSVASGSNPDPWDQVLGDLTI